MKKCKECGIEKPLDLFYSHPGTKDGKVGRCKECVKRGRSSEREREMARNNDKKRIRPEGYGTSASRMHREKYPEKYKARGIVDNYYRYRDKPNSCSICNSRNKIQMHHEDYGKPREIVPLCSMCHAGVHKGELIVNSREIITIG